MDDHVFIEGLALETCIGVYDWERKIRQRVVLDLRLFKNLDAAAASDALCDTLDYKALSDRLTTLVEGARFELLEALAAAILQMILAEFDVRRAWLKLSKPGAVPQAANVGVVMSRERDA